MSHKTDEVVQMRSGCFFTDHSTVSKCICEERRCNSIHLSLVSWPPPPPPFYFFWYQVPSCTGVFCQTWSRVKLVVNNCDGGRFWWSIIRGERKGERERGERRKIRAKRYDMALFFHGEWVSRTRWCLSLEISRGSHGKVEDIIGGWWCWVQDG